MARKPKASANPFAAHVASVAGAVDVAALGKAIGKLLRPKPVASRAKPLDEVRVVLEDFAPQAAQRARRRRIGKFQRWETTGKWNDARRGTFRHYLIAVCQAMRDTTEAEATHALSNYASKKLDIAWVAANGYIKFI